MEALPPPAATPTQIQCLRMTTPSAFAGEHGGCEGQALPQPFEFGAQADIEGMQDLEDLERLEARIDGMLAGVRGEE